MSDIGIEIHAVEACRADGSGRVLGVRIRGVADQRERPVFITVCPAPGHDRDISLWAYEFGIQASARFLSAREAEELLQSSQFHSPARREGRPAAHPWCVEIDLLRHPRHPAVSVGPQERPLIVQASYLGGPRKDDPPQTSRVSELTLVKEYPLGVLFIHGIGLQARSETLSAWTAPILQWMNTWFESASQRLADRAETQDAEGWLSALVLREEWGLHDSDAGERHRLAADFVSRATARLHGDARQRMRSGATRALRNSAQRSATGEEQAARARFEQHLGGDLSVKVVHGSAVLGDARLIDGDAPNTAPSSVEVRIAALTAEGKLERSTWLMAESMWAGSFLAPRFGPFFTWSLATAPVLWVHALGMKVLRSGGSLPRALPSVLAMTSVVLFATLGMLLVGLLASVPVERLRSALLKMQGLLAGVVGDSYVFLQDAVQRRAIVDRVQRDVEWLSQRCRKVVVVAHSQGAAVADQAINTPLEYQPEALRALVTLGSGVQTLDRLGQLRKERKVVGAGWSALVCAAVLWVGPAWAWWQGSVWIGGLAGFVGATGLAVAATVAWVAHPGWFGRRSAASIWPWHDFYASHDPVPMGPLTDPEDPGLHYRPHEVVNQASFLQDHTTYWANPEQVVGPVVTVIAEAAGTTVFDDCVPDAAAVRTRLAASRQARIVWLEVARWVSLLGVAFLLWAQRGLIDDFASWVVSGLGLGGAPVPFPGWLATFGLLSISVPWLLQAGVLASVWEAWGEADRRRLMLDPSAEADLWWPCLYALALASMPAAVLALGGSISWPQAFGLWPAASVVGAVTVVMLHRRRLAAV